MPQSFLAAPSESTQVSVFAWVFPQGFFLDVKCQRQPPNELLKFGDPLRRGIRLFISGFKEGGFPHFQEAVASILKVVHR